MILKQRLTEVLAKHFVCLLPPPCVRNIFNRNSGAVNNHHISPPRYVPLSNLYLSDIGWTSYYLPTIVDSSSILVNVNPCPSLLFCRLILGLPREMKNAHPTSCFNVLSVRTKKPHGNVGHPDVAKIQTIGAVIRTKRIFIEVNCYKPYRCKRFN